MDASNWVSRVDARIHTLLAEYSGAIGHLGDDVHIFTGYANSLMTGGKRFRSLFCALGYSTAQTDIPDGLLDVATGLEFFHAAALAHDDIMDNSDTRRGVPSSHRFFEGVHRDSGWAGDAEHFGRSSALLFGDYLLAMSDAVVSRGLAFSADAYAATRARAEFDCMRFDVTAGQYLDIVEENAWPKVSVEDMLGRASTVLTYKSAKYSIEAPLVIGASLAGASEQLIAGIRAFAVPLGNAFQLRDDVLGVFGDAAVTGKPVGDDIREGKRTVLVALTTGRIEAADRDRLNATLGNANLSDSDISWAQNLFVSTGARAEIEQRIDDEFASSMAALDALDISDEARGDLHALALRVVQRDA